MVTYPDFRGTPEERFWAKVDQNGPVNPRTGTPCWVWTAHVEPSGHGRFRVGNRMIAVHRFSWELLRGPIPDGYFIDHDNPLFGCNNPACVNPDHLDPVPKFKNDQRLRRMKSNNTSGARNVSWCKRDRTWIGCVTAGGKHYRWQSKDKQAVIDWVQQIRETYHT